MSSIFCMEIDGIPGAEKIGTLSGQILIESFDFGADRFLRSGIGHGKNREFSVPSISNINIVKNFDDMSTKIHAESLFGKGKTIKLRVLKSADNMPAQTTTTITLSDAILSSHHVDAHILTGLKEHLTLSFSKYTIEHTPVDSNGKKMGSPSMIGYDIAKVKKI